MQRLKVITDLDLQLAHPVPTTYTEREASRVVLFDENKKIALLYVTKKGYHKLPGGGMNVGETLLDTLSRELKEEVGCVAGNFREVGMIEEYRNKFALHQVSYGFVADLVGEKGEPQLEEDEIADGFKTVWMNLEEAISMLEKDKSVIEDYGARFICERDLVFLKACRSMNSFEPQEEVLQCFDDLGRPTEGRPRSEVKTQPYRWWYGVSSVWVLNEKREILCSKRSEQLRGNPGKWQTYFGGHVTYPLSFEENALKELSEECGIRMQLKDLVLIEEGRREGDHHFFKKYAVLFREDESMIQFTDGEVTDARWMTPEQYWKEKADFPERWCNRFLPEHQEKLVERQLLKRTS